MTGIAVRVAYRCRHLRSGSLSHTRKLSAEPSQRNFSRAQAIGTTVGDAAVGKPVAWERWRAGGWFVTPESFADSPLAEYWGTLAEQPLDVRSFLGRQAINAKLMGAASLAHLFTRPDGLLLHGSPTGHFLWAYAGQLDWQWRTGRLGSGVSKGRDINDHISSESWWGCMNYTLSVLPMAAAVDAGVLKLPLELQQGGGMDEAGRPELAAARASWAEFWRGLLDRARRTRNALDDQERDFWQGQAWLCHTATLEVAEIIYNQKLQLLPSPEQRFGRGWTTFVESLAMIRWRTDLDALASLGAGFLPPFILDGDGWERGLRTMDAVTANRVANAVEITFANGALPEGLRSATLQFWRRAARSRQGRAAVQPLLADLTLPSVGDRTWAVAQLLLRFVFPGDAD